MKPSVKTIEADVLVIGAGGAGMYAAIEAARQLGPDARVVLADRSLIGRGGATIMAQMTVAVAMGHQQDDHWEHHFNDTLTAGRGLCDPALARLLCEQGPAAIRELDDWGVGWARQDGRNGTPGSTVPMRQAHAPGHDRPRCVYVDFLNTGPAVSKTLRAQLNRMPNIQRIGDLLVTELICEANACVGAVALDISAGTPVRLNAKATVVATGGLTRLYARNSASANMGGDGYALCLAAGAPLMDMEFVQFFPIGHLAPRLIGMDPIMWDPFRYKLGGRLLNGLHEEFVHQYGASDAGQYVVTRDLATYAITKEVAAGRGSPHGGAWLSFEHISEAQLRAAGGPVIDRLLANGIDLTRQAIEVAPIAHYHMGGVQADVHMATRVPGLFVAGEAVGGANGANRLSGNAITEALVFGRVAGESAAQYAKTHEQCVTDTAFVAAVNALVQGGAAVSGFNPAAGIETLQAVMQLDVGPFRTAEGLQRALTQISALQTQMQHAKPAAGVPYDTALVDWLDLRTMLSVADCVTRAALQRTESRGAHQREDFPGMEATWERHLRITSMGQIESSQ